MRTDFTDVWPVNVTFPKDEEVEFLKRTVKQYKALLDRERFIDDSSRDVICKEAKLQRERAILHKKFLGKVMDYALEKGDRDLVRLIEQGLMIL